ncbi:MAG: hypothetical protein JEZ09_11850 [Salinivirgaceae bacterium]|nr:hypothetical protein [Salinivirgaceae bacterium]
MPYRRLPNTDSARLRALKTALDKTEDFPPFKLPFSVSVFQELKYFYPEFKQAMLYQKETFDRQTARHKSHAESFKKAKLYLSHFIQVFNLAIIRGELKPETRSIFNLEGYINKLPQLNTEKELIKWGELLIKGEQIRLSQGNTPITNPTIARVNVHYEEFLKIHRNQKNLQETHNKAVKKVSELRAKADRIILNIWNEVEEYYSKLSVDEKRFNAEKYGVIYVYRKNEKISFSNLSFETMSSELKIG